MRTRLIVVAAAALLVTAGAARAADVMPIVVPVTPTPPTVAAGPTISVDLASTISFAYFEPGQFYVDIGFNGDIDVRSISGWGFRLSGGGGANLIGGSGFGAGFSAEVYKAIGNAQIGWFVSPDIFGAFGITFGPTLRYETDTVDFRHSTSILIANADRAVDFYSELTLNPNDRLEIGGYFDLEFGTFFDPDLDLGGHATLTVNDRLDVTAWIDADLLGFPDFEIGGGAELHFGPFSPYAYLYWSSDFGLGADLGFDFKKPIGGGPLQLIGGLEADFDLVPGFDVDFFGYGGIRYLIGEDDDDY